MHLKKLTLRGFKSFASATTLQFEPGITCVVGPNGSGKSNVVDALAWVMGEQGAKSLRGGNMADVIFAGTSARPALGRAEVALTIDNTDGALPIEYTEVTISRTMFQSGGSEYAINGSSCRLLDIQELLSDSGMGNQMHVIIGQGRLDSVLAATAEERRGFIEEAAGVLKHRKRKEKALRKLEAMAANLDRVSDLVAEIRRQLGPLAKQADVARRAHVVQADLWDAKARLFADDLVQLQAALEAERADETALRQRRDEVEQAQQHTRARITEVEAAAAAAAPELNQASEMWFRLSSVRERLRSTASLAHERLRLLDSDDEIAPTGPDPQDLDEQARQARRTEAELTQEHTTARADLEATIEERHQHERAAAQAEAALAQVHRGAADRREGIATLSGRVSTARSRLEANEDELERLRATHADAVHRAGQAQERYAALEQEAVGAEAGEKDLDTAYETALEVLNRAEATVTALLDRHRTATGEHDTWTARRDALDLSLTRKDGTGALLSGENAGIIGAVADHIRIRPGYENAIGAALGAWADAALAESPDAAHAALTAIRAADAGRAHVIVRAGQRAPAPGTAPEGCWALELIDAEEGVAAAVSELLRGVVVVADPSAARRVTDAADLTAVTEAGDVFARTHMRGGAGGAPSVLELHAARDEAAATVEAAAHELTTTEAALAPAREQLQLAQADADAALGALHDSDAALAAVAEQLGQFGSAMRAATAEAERTATAITSATEAQAGIGTELSTLIERLDAARAQPDHAETDLAAATGHRDETAAAATEARSRETEARLLMRTLEERLRAISTRAASLEKSAETERRARVAAEERARHRAQQAALARDVAAGAQRALVAIETSLQTAMRQRDEAQAAGRRREEELTTLRSQVDELATEHAQLTDVVHADEVARAGQQSKIDQLTTRAADDLGLAPDVLVDDYGPHLLIPAVPGPNQDPDDPPAPVPFVRAEQEKRLHSAERSLKLLGKVNPLALEEHAALEQRHKFLADQLADIEQSRADLIEIIRELDERVQAVFADAFADTAAQFEQVFARLFPGGQGRLVLTDPGDMLTTGIEVEARPPGKKVKRLSLLSGGERSLTAVAILVAIFRARPSPFYVMDEVEAALDDVNLGRLIDIFSELREDSQLIIITHQKRTMEVADALYGTTMRGDGITTLISQRLE